MINNAKTIFNRQNQIKTKDKQINFRHVTFTAIFSAKKDERIFSILKRRSSQL